MAEPKAIRLEVAGTFSELINLMPAAYGTDQIPPGPLEVDFGASTQEYLDGDFKKSDNWAQLLLQLKDVPFPDFTGDVDFSLIFRPHVNPGNPMTTFSVVWDVPKRLKNPRYFSIAGTDANSPPVLFDGTADVVLVPHNTLVDQWRNEISLVFNGAYASGLVSFDGSTDETIALQIYQADKWTTPRTVSFVGGDATGNYTRDGSANSSVTLAVHHATMADTAAYATLAGKADGLTGNALSNDPGNLLQLRPDGLYYGTQSPAQYAAMYIDAVNGNDGNIGTRVAPLKTIKACLAQGPQGIERSIFLYNGQSHEINPADPVTVRGGRVVVYPYGPGVDALPPVAGDSKLNQQAATDLNTRIQCLPAVTVDAGGLFVQSAESLLLREGGSVIFSAIRIISPVNNGSGLPFQSGRSGAIGATGNALVQLVWSDSILPEPLTDLISESPQSPLSVVWFQGAVSGVGKIIRAVNTNFSFTVFGSRTADSTLVTYFGGVATATKTVYNMSTNLNPTLFP